MAKTTAPRARRRPARTPAPIEQPAGDLLDLYIADAHRSPLHSAAEQKALARVMRDETRPEAERAAARETLIAANLRFAFSIAKQYQHRGLDLADLVAEANSGLVRAADKYDPDVGVNFISYAVWWIRQAVHAAIAKHSRTVRLPPNRGSDLTKIARARDAARDALGREPSPEEIARVAGLGVGVVKDLLGAMLPERSLDEPVADQRRPGVRPLESVLTVETDTPSALPGNVEAQSLREALFRALDELPPRDRRVLIMYYGLGGEEPKTLREISQRLGVTHERVRQLRDRALAAIREGEAATLLKEEWAA
ncbi:MAG TPA: RNA polymerase sigma factor RpoD/SigA [Gemmatimonadaceae bacterium]|nr:RNA polymerase sigma factor RpoD/SigA [Gemmatimonadaceae bacterium]